MTDIFVVGTGPAGISASIYGIRAGFSVTAAGKDKGSLGKTDKIENYYGFSEPISAIELYNNGLAQAKRLGVSLIEDEVFDISYDENFNFKVVTNRNTYETRCVILAAGSSRKTPHIRGLKEYEGKGVSYCAVCDAFFHRGKRTAVIGNAQYAVNEALHLKQTSSEVIILTNGKEMQAELPDGINADVRKIREITGESTVEKVVFEDGDYTDFSGIFVAIGTASATDLARKLGLVDPDSKIMVNPDMSTILPGFYTAGDCNGGMLQIAKAVYEGAQAATSAIRYLRK